ncbi:DNA polymerase IV [Gordonia sp. OPL2]|uniref:DNA polymerase IV n=1 Tax=Gordonia sp. OPL2 TaxID=2486274 RepID=UPI0021CD0D24|nr:DNA polymerase IV [Gordonia sp. OPL2]
MVSDSPFPSPGPSGAAADGGRLEGGRLDGGDLDGGGPDAGRRDDGARRSARWVMHLDMDAFFASVEQLTRPTLRGRPVLVGGTGGRGVVAGASYAARAFGARSAMPMHQARRLVGAGAVVLPPRGTVYRVVSARIFGLVRDAIPVIEMLSFDEAFGEPEELAGASVDEVTEFAERLRRRIRETVGISASVGFGSGKQIAKIASGLAKPDGVMAISPAVELEFLHELPVRKLWGIGPVSGDRLHRLGIESIGDFAAMSDLEVVSVLGATLGPSLHRLAQGIDDRPVAERASAKQISAESTFPRDLVELSELRPAIESAAEGAHRRLLSDGRGARTVVLKLKRSDMSVLTRSMTLPAATTELGVLISAAQRLALDPRSIGPIRLVGVGYSGLTAVQQFSLFGDLDDEHGTDVRPVIVAEDGVETDVEAGFVAAGPSTDSAPVLGSSADTGSGEDENRWETGADLTHPDHGHGWVQGSGHGVVTVRFETRATGPGRAVTFRADDPELRRADPRDSLAWPDLPSTDPD